MHRVDLGESFPTSIYLAKFGLRWQPLLAHRVPSSFGEELHGRWRAGGESDRRNFGRPRLNHNIRLTSKTMQLLVKWIPLQRAAHELLSFHSIVPPGSRAQQTSVKEPRNNGAIVVNSEAKSKRLNKPKKRTKKA